MSLLKLLGRSECHKHDRKVWSHDQQRRSHAFVQSSDTFKLQSFLDTVNGSRVKRSLARFRIRHGLQTDFDGVERVAGQNGANPANSTGNEIFPFLSSLFFGHFHQRVLWRARINFDTRWTLKSLKLSCVQIKSAAYSVLVKPNSACLKKMKSLDSFKVKIWTHSNLWRGKTLW